MRPITGDMVVAFELEKLGIDFIDEWDFLQPDEIEKTKKPRMYFPKLDGKALSAVIYVASFDAIMCACV